MIERYIVSSPGRVASHVVQAMIQSCGKQAIHTHYPFYKTDDDTITGLVMVTKRNLFDAIMSNLVVNYTGQTTEYDKKEFDKFVVGKEQFEFQYNWHRWYLDNHDRSRPYGSVHTIYFEDFVDNYNHIPATLGLTVDNTLLNQYNPNFTKKAPYSYKELVINQDQCRVWYEELAVSSRFVPLTENDFKNLSDDERNTPWDRLIL